jgi:hypothetical protein
LKIDDGKSKIEWLTVVIFYLPSSKILCAFAPLREIKMKWG